MWIRVESGSDDLDYLGHLGHFLVGQVGLICKLNYLDVIQILIDHMFFRKRHWHLISSLANVLNHHWCETSYTASSCFEACGVQRFCS